MFRVSLVFLAMTFVVACNPVSIDDYQDSSPGFDIQQFFNGQLKAYGILQDRAGLVTRKFTADLEAYWEGNNGVLEEVFYFDDGEIQNRTWQLILHENGWVTGSAGDVIGTAEGQIQGAAFNWNYQLEVPYKDGTINVSLDDWLYMVDDGSLINKTELSKFGFRVGELTIFIQKI